MPEFILRLRCPACKYEEEEVVTADSIVKAKMVEKAEKNCPRQAHIKMEVVDVKEKQ